MDQAVIQTQGLSKRYGDFVAVASLDLVVKRAETYGLLGPNGSGKTTTILMLLGLTEPSAGKASILGFDPERQPLSVKAHVGYLPDQIGFYNSLTARENLIYIGKLNGFPREEIYRRMDGALERMGLCEVADQKVRTFSHGMRQRLGVAEILLKEPEIIIMDEPTIGLDPEGAGLFLRIIRHLNQEGITILLASHLLDQVQQVCDRVGLFHQGRIVLEGTVAELAQRVLGGGYRMHLEARGARTRLEKALRGLPGVLKVEQTGPERYAFEAAADMRAEAARAVVEAGGELMGLEVEMPNLNEIYARYFDEVEHAQDA